MLKMKSAAGPTLYVNGTGILIGFGEFESVIRVVAAIDNGDGLAANDTVYALRTSIVSGTTGQAVRVLAYVASTVGAGPNAWAEIGGLNLSGRTFTVLVEGE